MHFLPSRYFQNAMMKSHTTEYGSKIGVILHYDSTFRVTAEVPSSTSEFYIATCSLAPSIIDKCITYLSSTHSGPAEKDGSQISGWRNALRSALP